MEDYLTAKEASERAGVDERTVRRWISEGKLLARKKGGAFQIQVSDLDALLTSRPTRTKRSDFELEILMAVIQQLEALVEPERQRVLTFVVDRFDWIPPGS